jgi:hypothetical protein
MAQTLLPALCQPQAGCPVGLAWHDTAQKGPQMSWPLCLSSQPGTGHQLHGLEPSTSTQAAQ